MEELRLAFLVIGALAIAGILAHGLWSVRKQSRPSKEARFEPHDWQDNYDDAQDVDLDDDQDGIIEVTPSTANRKVEPRLSDGDGEYDDLGLGAVRVVSQEPSQAPADSETQQPTAESTEAPEQLDMSKEASALTRPQAETKPKIYSSVVTQPKPEYAAQQVHAMRSKVNPADPETQTEIPEPPPFLLKPGVDATPLAGDAESDTTQSATTLETPKASPDSSQQTSTSEPKAAEPSASPAEPAKVSLADQARSFVKRSKAESKPRKRKEPKIGEDQMRIDFDQIDDEPAPEISANDNSSAEVESSQPPLQEVLVLNVKAPEGQPIQGSALLPMLLTLGFKFGDQDIFHRHVNSNGKGPVLFSLANMFKPGVFDIDNLENFTTMGVSLFMMLPIEGDPHQVFNMMHNAARKIADEFSAQVLDGRRSALTKQSLQQYVEKIREFERKRMIAR